MDGDGVILNIADTEIVRHNGHRLAMGIYAFDNIRSVSGYCRNAYCPIAGNDTLVETAG